jgi:hypothetical protein
VKVSSPALLVSVDGDLGRLQETLAEVEPFASNLNATLDVLRGMGWLND